MKQKASNQTLTAAQEILLGAHQIDESGRAEFSEWDLTVETWKRNPNRFGCRGYEDKYPDHKRVMMEIMGGKKDNPVRRSWIEKVRPNTYRLTTLGRTEVERLEFRKDIGQSSTRSPQSIYDAVSPLYRSNVFRKHIKDPDEPRMWLGAASFFQLSNGDPQHLKDRLGAVDAAIQNAIDWMEENDKDVIHRGVSSGGESISLDSLRKLGKFNTLLRKRFADQIDAILGK